MTKEIDTIGLKCPEPLMIVRKEMRNLPENESIKVIADDPSTKRDFTMLCENMNYTLQSIEEHNGIFTFVITKY